MNTLILHSNVIFPYVTDREPGYSVGNFEQYLFYNYVVIKEVKYKVYFSYVVELNEEKTVSKIHIGYYINRDNGELVKSHIWIEDPVTLKRAAKEIYFELVNSLRFCYGRLEETESYREINKENYVWSENS